MSDEMVAIQSNFNLTVANYLNDQVTFNDRVAKHVNRLARSVSSNKLGTLVLGFGVLYLIDRVDRLERELKKRDMKGE